jgi:hypothetical protein
VAKHRTNASVQIGSLSHEMPVCDLAEQRTPLVPRSGAMLFDPHNWILARLADIQPREQWIAFLSADFVIELNHVDVIRRLNPIDPMTLSAKLLHGPGLRRQRCGSIRP